MLSISQISPKSISAEILLNQNLQTSSNLPMIESSQLRHNHDVSDNKMVYSRKSESDSTVQNHIPMERSASPILKDEFSKSTFDENRDKLEHLDTNDVEAVDGRYFNYIQPTTTSKVVESDFDEMTRSERMGKDLTLDPFLSKGGPRSLTSGSPPLNISPTNVLPMSPIATLTNHPRQNPNPDIQDIITGIVKLLNGNVNVHANTQLQSSRRPYTTRINNRGPPRISEAQPLPNDFEQLPPTSTMRPPPYPFDRPDAPIRPFINGVPLPEQIVPSMQQNYRPGFISQNRPPWQRPRPRPPLTGGRRPIPPYKPIPTMPEYRPEDDIQLTTLEIDTNSSQDLNPTDSAFDSSGYEVQEENSDDIESSTVEVMQTTSTKFPTKKEDFSKKKDKTKSTEKKPIPPVTQTEEPSLITIIHSKSEVHEYIETTSSDTKTSTESFASSSTIESSIDDIIPMSTSSSSDTNIETTPVLLSTDSSNMQITQDLIQSTSTPINQWQSSTTPIPIDTNYPYHPRPGIVLDDPEFKPGGGRLPAGQRPRPQVQPTRPVTPPGYGEIFDVTLSAIQGPSGSGSKQTIKIKPYDGTYASQPGNGNGDIIVSPNADDGFVSIDGKRTYLNLFGDSSETATSSSATQQQIVPTTISSVTNIPIRNTQQAVSI